MLAKSSTLRNGFKHIRLAYARYLATIFYFSVFGFFVVVVPQCAAPNRAQPIDQESGKNPPVIMDNTVVFFSISQADYDSLIEQKPEMANRMEGLMDYYHYALMAEQKLSSLGYTVIFGSWHEVTVQLEEGKTKKMVFNPADFKAILMKAKDKGPELVTGFDSDYDSISKIISKYFNIVLE
jgi:hypothetical protein